jgi:predicted DNA-binding transcriptional regulator AlpA
LDAATEAAATKRQRVWLASNFTARSEAMHRDQLASNKSERSSPPTDKSARLIAASKLLTPAEVAEITGLSIETLAQWRSQKHGIPYVKIARNSVRYRLVDLDQWIGERIVHVEHDPSQTRRNT